MCLQDPADYVAIGNHVVVVVTPLAPWAGSRGALEREIVFVHVSSSTSRLCQERRLHRTQRRQNPKQNNRRSKRRLRRRATGRRAEQGCASWRPFPLPIRKGQRPGCPPSASR